MASTKTTSRPDIGYYPNLENFRARTSTLWMLNKPEPGLPPDFPQELGSCLVWDNSTLKDEKDWTYFLNSDERAEIHKALIHFKGLHQPTGFVDAITFHLPTLGPTLRGLSKELHFGRGFFVLRGVEVDKYSIEENIIIFTGISSYIGSIRGRQQTESIHGTTKSTMLNHIIDLTDISPEDAACSPAYTRASQPFHTDAGDIVALLSLDKSTTGGEHKVASGWRVYNELARTRPDIIRTLANDWILDGEAYFISLVNN